MQDYPPLRRNARMANGKRAPTSEDTGSVDQGERCRLPQNPQRLVEATSALGNRTRKELNPVPYG